MTNRSDLNECSAQIKLVKRLLGPETFDLDKVLVKLQTKKKLLMKFSPRDYATILKGIESGALIHPGDWVKPPKKIEEKRTIPEEPKIDPEKARLERELQETKDKLAAIEAAKEPEDTA